MKKIIFLFACLLMATSALAGNPVIDAVSYSPAPAIPGEYFNLYVYLKNDSKYDSENVHFSIDLSGGTERESEYPFSLDAEVLNEKIIPTINPFRSVLMEYRIRVDSGALDGEYTILLNYKEADAQRQYKYTIKISSRKPDIEVINANIMGAAPGEVINLDLHLRNVGTGLAEDILAGIEEDRTVTTTGVVVEREFSALGSSFSFLKDLEPGKEANVQLTVAINPEAEQKTYTIPIKLKYKDTNAASYTKTTYVGLKVAQEPELDAVINEANPIAFPGGTSELTIDLFNVGIGTAKYVVAELSTDSGDLEQNKEFIGTLEADDFDSFKVDFTASPTADPAKEHFVMLTLNYKNQYGEARSLEKALPLKIHSAIEVQALSGATSPVLILFSLFMLAMQLLGLYVFLYKWLYKKKIKKGQ